MPPLLCIQTVLDMDSHEMGCPYRIYAPKKGTPESLVIAFHGGNFVDGSLEWDAAQNKRIANLYSCMVYQLGLPKTLAEFMKWCNSLALRKWLKCMAASYEGVLVLGRSSGGYLAKVFYETHKKLIARATYLCPVMDPFKRARLVADKRHGTYRFFAGCELPLGADLDFDDSEVVLLPHNHDKYVPIMSQPKALLRIAVRSKEEDHRTLCITTSKKTLKLLGFKIKE